MPPLDLTPFQPPEKPLSALATLRALGRNPIEAWPRGVYERDVTTISFPLYRAVFAIGPELVKEALLDRTEDFPKGALFRRVLGPALGENSLFTADGDAWRLQRRAAAPAFRHDLLLGLVPLFDGTARASVAALEARHGETIDIVDLTTRLTFDIIMSTVLSGGAEVDDALFVRAREAYRDALPATVLWAILRLPRWVPQPGRAKALRAVEDARGEVTRVVVAARARTAPKGDLIDLLMAARDPVTGEGLSDRDLRDDIVTFIGAGHEATAVGLAWTLWLLDRHPEWRDRVEAEIDAVVGDGPVLATHIPALETTARVLQESMRLFPPSAVSTRVARVDTELGGERVPAGTDVIVPVYAIHRHAALWDRPGVFDPDRFLPAATKARHRCAYIPFGIGPRVCIGAAFSMMQMATVLAVLLRRLRFRAVSDAIPRPVWRIVLQPEGGIPMRVETR